MVVVTASPEDNRIYAGEAVRAATNAYLTCSCRRFKTPADEVKGAIIAFIVGGNRNSFLPSEIDLAATSSDSVDEANLAAFLSDGYDVFLAMVPVARGSGKNMPSSGGASVRFTGTKGLSASPTLTMVSTGLTGGGTMQISTVNPGSATDDKIFKIGVFAGNILTLSGVAVAAETVTVGTVVYTWRAAVGATANEVKVEATASACIDNLVAAITHGAGSGSTYGSGTVVNPDVTAIKLSVSTMRAVANNASIMTLVATEAMTNAAWGDTSGLLVGPTGGTYTLTANAQTTGLLAAAATYLDIESALLALAAMNPGDVTVADAANQTGSALSTIGFLNDIDFGATQLPLYGNKYDGNGMILPALVYPYTFATQTEYPGYTKADGVTLETIHPSQDGRRLTSFMGTTMYVQFWLQNYADEYVGKPKPILYGGSWAATAGYWVLYGPDRGVGYHFPGATTGQQDAEDTSGFFSAHITYVPQTSMQQFANTLYLSGVPKKLTAPVSGPKHLDDQSSTLAQKVAGSTGALSVSSFGVVPAALYAANQLIPGHCTSTSWDDTIVGDDASGGFTSANTSATIVNPHHGWFVALLRNLMGGSVRHVTVDDVSTLAPLNYAAMLENNLLPVWVADEDDLITSRLAFLDEVYDSLPLVGGDAEPVVEVAASAISLGYSPRGEMVAEIGRLIEDTSTARKVSINDALARAYDGLLAQYKWPQLTILDETGLRKRDASYKTLLAGEPEFPMPIDAGQIVSLLYQDILADPIEIVAVPRLLQLLAGDITLQRRPFCAAVIGTTPQYRRLAAAGVLTVTCPDTDANDHVLGVTVEYAQAAGMSGQKARIIVSGAFASGVSITPAAAAGYPISKLHIPVAWKGGLQIADALGTVIVDIRSTIEPQATTASPSARTYANTLFRAGPTPDADYGLTIVAQRRPHALDHDSDVPEMPVSTYLVEKVAAEMLRQMGDRAASGDHEAEARIYLAQLIHQAAPVAQIVPPMRGNFLSATGIGWRGRG